MESEGATAAGSPSLAVSLLDCARRCVRAPPPPPPPHNNLCHCEQSDGRTDGGWSHGRVRRPGKHASADGSSTWLHVASRRPMDGRGWKNGRTVVGQDANDENGAMFHTQTFSASASSTW